MTDEKTRAVLEEMRALEKSHRIQSRDGFRADHAAEADRLKRWGDAFEAALTVPDGDAREKLKAEALKNWQAGVEIRRYSEFFTSFEDGFDRGYAAALSRAAAREKVEWETTLVWDHAHRLDMSEGSRWPDLRSALEQHGHDPTLADQADSLSYNLGGGSPDYRAAPKLMRRRKAGPWEPVGGES